MKLRYFLEPFASRAGRRRKFAFDLPPPSGRTLSGAPGEGSDSAAIAAAVKITAGVEANETADRGDGELRIRITGAAGTLDADDRFSASGGSGQPVDIDPYHLVLARAASRRVAPLPRLRSLRAFARTRHLLPV